MKEGTSEQIAQWLKKLERESWQLELLVSGFTIFLLIAAEEVFGDFITGLTFEFYGPVANFIFFLDLIHVSIIALIAFLVLHLLLRGFWIGAIGLRSVQPTIAYEKLNYSAFFLNKLKKKVIGLDRLVIVLDELCSVIFSISFLIIFMIISFGLYFLFLGLIGGLLEVMMDVIGMEFEGTLAYAIGVLFFVLILSGVIYLLDYFTLGFFKRFRRLSVVYYPIYRFCSAITLSFISRSIYYNLISKYSKRRIRWLLVCFICLLVSYGLVNYDQYPYFPEGNDQLILDDNYYDDSRGETDYIHSVSVESKLVTRDFISLFIRYNPRDNEQIKDNCPGFEPLKNDGINSNLRIRFNEGMQIQNEHFEEEDKEMLLHCLSELYEVAVNDSVYQHLRYYFYKHPAQDQRGIITMISSKGLTEGENIIFVRKKGEDTSDSLSVFQDFAQVPVWYAEE